MTLTFTPAESLKPSTMYTTHLGGGMMDHEGDPVNFDHHGPQMGGHWVGEEMFNAGMMGGGPGAGGPAGGTAHMGDGWRHHNGSYGMAFSFTTAG